VVGDAPPRIEDVPIEGDDLDAFVTDTAAASGRVLFDLGSAPPWRLLFVAGGGRQAFVLIAHHVLLDLQHGVAERQAVRHQLVVHPEAHLHQRVRTEVALDA
ncbi:hypothetical protein K7G98_37590, partial [Saccharothrix sp. MB29]|nr:hypothetical protein [Saccharothrix sp. MB29]